MIAMPPTLDSKEAFCIRVLTTSKGEATVMDATAPVMEATKSAVAMAQHLFRSSALNNPLWVHVAVE